MLRHENENQRYEHVPGWQYFCINSDFEVLVILGPFLRNKRKRKACEIMNTVFPNSHTSTFSRK